MEVIDMNLMHLIWSTPLVLSMVLLPVSAKESEDFTGFDVESFYADTIEYFSNMKKDYAALADNYGNIEVSNVSDVYLDYLYNIQENNERMDYEGKLTNIKEAGAGMMNEEMSQRYASLKEKMTSSFGIDGMNMENPTAADIQSMIELSEKASVYKSMIGNWNSESITETKKNWKIDNREKMNHAFEPVSTLLSRYEGTNEEVEE